jgi:hypothetical protein
MPFTRAITLAEVLKMTGEVAPKVLVWLKKLFLQLMGSSNAVASVIRVIFNLLTFISLIFIICH